MSRRPATVTQADVARVIRAAKQGGARQVVVRPDGHIVILIDEDAGVVAAQPEVDDDDYVRLG